MRGTTGPSRLRVVSGTESLTAWRRTAVGRYVSGRDLCAGAVDGDTPHLRVAGGARVRSVWVPLAGGAGVEYSRGARNVYAGPRRGTDLEASATRNHRPARGSRCQPPNPSLGVRRVRRDDLRCGTNHIAIRYAAQ